MRLGFTTCVSSYLVGLMASSAAFGATVTFGFSGVDRLDLAGPRTEAGFTYEVDTGQGWEITTSRGNPAGALSTYFNDESSEVGDTVVFTAADAASFTFDRVDWRTNSASTSDGADHVVITGYLSNVPVGSLTLDGLNTTYTTAISPFTGVLIDELRVTVSQSIETASARHLDNFVFNIPEPATAMLLVATLMGLSQRRRPQPRQR